MLNIFFLLHKPFSNCHIFYHEKLCNTCVFADPSTPQPCICQVHQRNTVSMPLLPISVPVHSTGLIGIINLGIPEMIHFSPCLLPGAWHWTQSQCLASLSIANYRMALLVLLSQGVHCMSDGHDEVNKFIQQIKECFLTKL